MNILNLHDIAKSYEPDAMSCLLDFSSFWGRSWRLKIEERQCCKGSAVAPTTTEDSIKSADILHPRTHLPNNKFLSLLLEFVHTSDCTPRLPLGIVKLIVNNFALFQEMYPQQTLDQNTDLLIGAIDLSIQDHHDVLVQAGEDSFYVVSFEASLSSLTKMAAELRKRINGLTIPYPSRQVFSEVSVSAGIALFMHVDGVKSWEDFLSLADQAMAKSLLTGKAEALIGMNPPA